MAVSTVAILNAETVTLIVLIVSQLVKLDTVSTILAAPLNTCPKIVNGSCAAQIVVSIVAVLNGETLTLVVLIVSQLVGLETVSVIDPAALNTYPNIVNGS